MKHAKTFEAIAKLKDIEIEIHRLKNALEMANKALDAQRTWVSLTDEEQMQIWDGIIKYASSEIRIKDFARAIEAKLKEKNT